jgi:outer membrane protein
MMIMLYKNPIVAIIALQLLLLSHLYVQAQDTRELTLKEAIQLSIKNSKQLQLNRARIDEAVAATREATQRRLPDAGISANFLEFSNAKVQSYRKDTSAIAPLGINQAIYGTATITYPIFSGFKIRYGIESARYLEQATMLDAEDNKQQVFLNTISAYVNLYKANITERLIEENLSQSRQRDTDFSNLEKNGLLARNDLLKAQLQTSQIELGLLDAENDIQFAQVNMNLLLGLPETTKLILDSASLKPPVDVKSIGDYEQLALQNRFDVKALDNRMRAADARLKVAKGDYYPTIGLSGGYVAANLPKFITITNAFNIGIAVQYSLSSIWKTEAKMQQAKAREQQLHASKEMLLDDIRLSINKAFEDYYSGLKKIDVLNKEVEQSAENYRISKNKYNNSLLTLTDLLDADVAQLRARLNLTLAKADAYIAYQTLLQKAGLLDEQTILK